MEATSPDVPTWIVPKLVRLDAAEDELQCLLQSLRVVVVVACEKYQNSQSHAGESRVRLPSLTTNHPVVGVGMLDRVRWVCCYHRHGLADTVWSARHRFLLNLCC